MIERAARVEQAFHKQADEYKCPITMELIVDPVLATDGRLYEREAIEKWLQTNRTSPVTNEPMEQQLIGSIQARRASAPARATRA